MPTVLVFSGLDPSGGAGIAADIETINQFGVIPLHIATLLTVQNTCSVKNTFAIDSEFMIEQFHHLQADIEFSVVKIGLLGENQIKILAQLLSGQNLKIVLDPIVKSSSKSIFLNAKAIKILNKTMLPLVDVLTPNLDELFFLSGEKNEEKAIKLLPCEWVLLTSADADNLQIEHRLYHHAKLCKRFGYAKLPHNYHGSGCTLSAAISALLALDFGVEEACAKALDYTYQTLLNAKKVGKMQYHPYRQKP